MNNGIAKSVALDFLRAGSTEDVKQILTTQSEFDNDRSWKPYGGADKNWDRVGVQTSEAVGALAELIINSIDAILMRRAREEKIDMQSETVPKKHERSSQALLSSSSRRQVNATKSRGENKAG